MTLGSLVRRLRDSRHQPARVMATLRMFGPDAAAGLVAWARHHDDSREAVAEALGQLGSVTALDALLQWSADERPALRAASIQAVGDIGLDDRAYYHALRALRDDDERVRAMAARALGRSRREEAAPYLSACLSDSWLVAAHGARALKQLGARGLEQLTAAGAGSGMGSDLARQMLWEMQS